MVTDRMNTVSYEQTLGLIERAIEEKGAGYVYKDEYSTCSYFSPDKKQTPRCIVGHVLEYLGTDKKVFADLMNNSMVFASLINLNLGVEFDEESVSLLTFIQHYQDYGYSWGEAYREALK